VQAFAPSVAVSSNGRIALAYYDFRNDNSDPSVLLTNYWRITSSDGGKTWTEISLSSPFDLRTAPFTGLGYMVTDYEGLVAIGNSFSELFVTANSGNTANPTDVFFPSTETSLWSTPASDGHVEINSLPRTKMEQRHPSVIHPR
jgi:Neuraminidase (sialidase)